MSQIRRLLPFTLLSFVIMPLTSRSQQPSGGNLTQKGIAEFREGRYASAEALLLEALESSRRSKNRDSIATTLGALGDVYFSEEHVSEAEQVYDQALSMFRQKPENNVGVTVMLRNLGALYSLEERDQEAVTALNNALKTLKIHGIEEPALVAQILNSLGGVYSRQHHLKNAEMLLRQAMQLNAAAGAELPTAENLNNLALLYREQHRYASAEWAYQRSLELSERFLGQIHPDIALTRANLGLLYTDMRRFEDAKTQYLLSLAITEQVEPVIEARVIRTLYLLSAPYIQTGEKAEAERVLARAAAIAGHSRLNNETPIVLDAYSDILRSVGKLQDARNVHAEAKRVRAELALTVHIKNRD